jgi:hypothetical protein
MLWRLSHTVRFAGSCGAKVCSQTALFVEGGFCAGLFWASSAILGVESAWNVFVTGVDWYKDGGGCARGMSGSRIVGLKLRDGLISADSYRTGATSGHFARWPGAGRASLVSGPELWSSFWLSLFL